MFTAKKQNVLNPGQIKLSGLRQQLESRILGQKVAIEYCLASLLCGGHVLLEGPPGIGKTSLAQGIAGIFQGTFRRVQMTSDLLPSDIVGTLRIRPGAQDFEFRPGPIFTQVLLADELNRTSARTQAALLEAMAEGRVSVDGTTYNLPSPFFVIATQNPQEFQGVYPLSESQLDRFLLQVLLDLPDHESELELYKRHTEIKSDVSSIVPFTSEDLLAIRKEVSSIHIEPDLLTYVQKIAQEVRSIEGVQHGASVRAVLQLIDVARAIAFLDGRNFTHPDDFKRLAPAVFAHRLCLNSEISSKQRKELVSEAVDRVAAPK